MIKSRSLADRKSTDLDEWVRTWSATPVPPTLCDKMLAEADNKGRMENLSKHAVFRIETPSLTVRLHHGTNHQVPLVFAEVSLPYGLVVQTPIFHV